LFSTSGDKREKSFPVRPKPGAGADSAAARLAGSRSWLSSYLPTFFLGTSGKDGNSRATAADGSAQQEPSVSISNRSHSYSPHAADSSSVHGKEVSAVTKFEFDGHHTESAGAAGAEEGVGEDSFDIEKASMSMGGVSIGGTSGGGGGADRAGAGASSKSNSVHLSASHHDKNDVSQESFSFTGKFSLARLSGVGGGGGGGGGFTAPSPNNSSKAVSWADRSMPLGFAGTGAGAVMGRLFFGSMDPESRREGNSMFSSAFFGAGAGGGSRHSGSALALAPPVYPPSRTDIEAVIAKLQASENIKSMGLRMNNDDAGLLAGNPVDTKSDEFAAPVASAQEKIEELVLHEMEM
jgi:hypothetical protein